MNNFYKIKLKDGNVLAIINGKLTAAWYKAGYEPFNEALKQYGLSYSLTLRNSTYEVIDQELFGIFLLEYSDHLIIKEVKV